LLQPLEHTRAWIVACKNSAGREALLEHGDNARQQAIHPLRKRLHDQIVAVTVDDQRREKVGFAVNQPVGGGIDAEGAAETCGRVDSVRQ
jgi:hypothetical protein